MSSLPRLLVLAAAASALWMLPRSDRWTVAGDSMAPTLLGPHYALDCPDCRFPFAVSAAAAGDTAVCPNCGRREVAVVQATWGAPDRPLLAPDARLRRWSLAAYRTRSGDAMVKRVVGLPGERVEMRGGDVWIDGRRLEKSLSELRRLDILVHDSRHVSREIGPRWHVSRGNWDSRRPGAWRLQRGRGELTYRHLVSYATRAPRTEPDAVRDYYGFNASLSRSLHPVNDQRLQLRVRTAGAGELSVHFDLGGEGDALSLRWDFGRGRLTASNGQTADMAGQEGWTTLEVARCDGRLLAALDGRQVISVANSEQGPGSPQPWRIEGTVAGGSIEVDRIRIWRDLHCYSPPGSPTRWTLAEDQWLLVGDNLPVSWDSRQAGPVPGSSLLGGVTP